MSTATPEAQKTETIADVLLNLGGVSAERIRFHPPPGTATESDVIRIEEKENRLFELVDGVLVEKVMGFRESLLAVALAAWLRDFVNPGNLGLVTGADGMVRLFPGLVRIPDVAFVSWNRIPGGRVPDDPIPDLIPDLAVEVLSRSNTQAELTRKLGEYFAAGIRLVWLVDPVARTVAVCTSPEKITVLSDANTLDGEPVLKGFSLPLGKLFAELDRINNGSAD